MKYATYIALIATVSSVEGSKLNQVPAKMDKPPARMEKPPAMAQVKSQARAKKDAEILDKVRKYKSKHGERLAQKEKSQSKKPVTGPKTSKKTNSTSLAQTHEEATTLRDAADGLGIYVGSAMKYKNMLTDEDVEGGQYASKFLEEFDIMTTENWCKPAQMLKSTDDTLDTWYNKYDGCHYMNDWAVENEIAHRGHALVWPSPGKYPDWFEDNYYDADGAYADEVEAWMIDYIIEVMNEMGELYAWDVMNEAVHNSAAESDTITDYLKTTPFTPIDDFICTAFKTAKTVSDENGWNTLMFYNEYDFESAAEGSEFYTKSANTYHLMKHLVDNDCGIDGVGYQTHIDIGYSDDDIQGIKDSFDMYADLGLYTQFTEIDVRCGKANNNSKYTAYCELEEGDEWTDEMLTAQGDVYRKLANACIFKSNCLSFETWGYVDGDYSFLSDPMNGFMFDDEYNTKKAYTQVFNKLANANRSNNEVVARLAGEI